MFKILKSPWQTTLINLIKTAKTNVYLACPYIKVNTALLIANNVNHEADFKYINSFKLAHFLTGASDLEALRILGSTNCKQKNIQKLHAKLFILDDTAIITSGNLTPGGLRNNLEYGVIIEDEIVDNIKTDYLDMFNNREYPFITFEVINRAQNILDSVPKQKQRKIRISEKQLFDEAQFDQSITDRFDGGIKSILSNLSPWEKDVFDCLLDINDDVFTLQKVYSYESHLSKLHSRNYHVKDKIRQQLQLLRDIGL